MALNLSGLAINHRTTKEAASGDDTISNSGGIAVLANSQSTAGSGAVSIEGDASAKSTSNAKSTATGIDAGAGNDKVSNSGAIAAEAGALATGAERRSGIKERGKRGNHNTGGRRDHGDWQIYGRCQCDSDGDGGGNHRRQW